MKTGTTAPGMGGGLGWVGRWIVIGLVGDCALCAYQKAEERRLGSTRDEFF